MGQINYTTADINTLLTKTNGITKTATEINTLLQKVSDLTNTAAEINAKLARVPFAYVPNLGSGTYIPSGTLVAEINIQSTAIPLTATRMYFSNTNTTVGIYIGIGTTDLIAKSNCFSAHFTATQSSFGSTSLGKYYIPARGVAIIDLTVDPAGTYTYFSAKSNGTIIANQFVYSFGN